MTQNTANYMISQTTPDGRPVVMLITQHYNITISTHGGLSIVILRLNCLAHHDGSVKFQRGRMPTFDYFCQGILKYAPALETDMQNAGLDFGQEMTTVYQILNPTQAA